MVQPFLPAAHTLYSRGVRSASYHLPTTSHCTSTTANSNARILYTQHRHSPTSPIAHSSPALPATLPATPLSTASPYIPSFTATTFGTQTLLLLQKKQLQTSRLTAKKLLKPVPVQAELAQTAGALPRHPQRPKVNIFPKTHPYPK